MEKVSSAEFAEQFYRRQTLIGELGVSGQEKLGKSKVAVVGVGGLGSVASLYLALAGVGYLRLIDQDTVEISNFHRQILYTPDDLHQPKAEMAAKRLSKQNPLVKVDAVVQKVSADNVESLLQDVDAVVDCVDNFETRFLVNGVCVKLGLPYVFGSVMGLEGNLAVFKSPETGCLECIRHIHSSSSQPKKALGILGVSAGIIGSLQAMETIKVLAGVGQPLKGKMLVVDFRDMDFTTVPLANNPKCPVCHGQ